MTNRSCKQNAGFFTQSTIHAMTVQDLLQHLASCPPGARVVVSGYEGGYNDRSILKTVRLQPDAHTEWWMGQHDDAEQGEAALLLVGENRLSEEYLGKRKGGGV
jgi:hypothetical protein